MDKDLVGISYIALIKGTYGETPEQVLPVLEELAENVNTMTEGRYTEDQIASAIISCLNIFIYKTDLGEKTRGQYLIDHDVVFMNERFSNFYLATTIFHEFAHAIQKRLGYSFTEYVAGDEDYETYHDQIEEVEARQFGCLSENIGCELVITYDKLMRQYKEENNQ